MSNYESTRELLKKLSEQARSLSSGLDDVTIGYTLLTDIHLVLNSDISVLYLSSSEGRLSPLAVRGSDTIPWSVNDFDESWQLARTENRIHERQSSLTGTGVGAHLVIPLELSDNVVGAVVMARSLPQQPEAEPTGTSGGKPDPTIESNNPWPAAQVQRAVRIANDAAIKIDTARLFREIREIATAEERRRLAREIHDGIAQEIASLGYVVDDIVADLHDPEVRIRVKSLRDELTRIVSELRLSIFDLRSDVQPETGLGGAISSYVRQVGTNTGLTVHLVLDETTTRLPVAVESELLRISQESITNVRKHANAQNLWVTCRIDPPRAILRIVDDGQGTGTARQDSYGIEIMRERAARISASLTIRGRDGGGTVVEVVL